MFNPPENSMVSQTVRERLQSPPLQHRFVFGEAENVSYYQFSLPAQEPVGEITLGPQVTSRVYRRVFWVAPKQGVMDNPRQMNSLLEEVSKGLFSYGSSARVNDGMLVYGRKDFWDNPYHCLNVELVALPHRDVLEMLQNYFGSKEDVHPSLTFENRAGLAYSISEKQLRVLHEREKELQIHLRESRQSGGLLSMLKARFRFLDK